MTVYFAVLLERSILEPAARALLGVCQYGGARGYVRLPLPYLRTDYARNKYVELFRANSTDEDDTLVMLDCDHAHPADIVEQLAAVLEENEDIGVVGALTFMRGGNHRPMFQVLESDGRFATPASWPEDSLLSCYMVGTGAIAIRRRVFDTIDEGYPGVAPNYFRYEYLPGGHSPSEDIYFGKVCHQAGIDHHVATWIHAPHINFKGIDEADWRAWADEHLDLMEPLEETLTPGPSPNGGGGKEGEYAREEVPVDQATGDV